MLTDTQRREKLHERLSATTYYAACEDGHAFWAGPDRGSYDAAQQDATDHDINRHGGTPTAVVLYV